MKSVPLGASIDCFGRKGANVALSVVVSNYKYSALPLHFNLRNFCLAHTSQSTFHLFAITLISSPSHSINLKMVQAPAVVYGAGSVAAFSADQLNEIFNILLKHGVTQVDTARVYVWFPTSKPNRDLTVCRD